MHLRRGILELREHLADLGYPRTIYVGTFKKANFELVAEILDWCVRRYNNNVIISDDITNESDRINFIKSIAYFFGVNSRIQFDTKKLYNADTTCINELLKITRLLVNSQNSMNIEIDTAMQTSFLVNSETDAGDEGANVALASKLYDVKNAKDMSTQLVEAGASLHEALETYDSPSFKETREKVMSFIENLSRSLNSTAEHDLLERMINRSTQHDRETTDQLTVTCGELQKDLERLKSQNKKKLQEIERAEKRLKSLQTVKPAFLEDYERHEKELIENYNLYIKTYRNLDYLEHKLDLYNSQEQERLEENQRRLKRMQKKLQEEEWRLLRGDADVMSTLPESPSNILNRSRVEGKPTERVKQEDDLFRGKPFSSEERIDMQDKRVSQRTKQPAHAGSFRKSFGRQSNITGRLQTEETFGRMNAQDDNTESDDEETDDDRDEGKRFSLEASEEEEDSSSEFMSDVPSSPKSVSSGNN